ncbi:MAG: COQ9 family protein [Alphaproteobacteria bacterium]|nr:COQ9 family protein [Alphaproteobacteria bacterium]
MSERETRRRAVLAAALPHVPFDGWTGRLLDRAAADLGLPGGETHRLFPGGASELLGFFAAEADRRMIEGLAAGHIDSLRVRERIALAVRIRLEAALPHREAVRRALAFYAMPHNAPAGTAALYRTVDAIWRALGDASTDFNFYTKRALLAGVYAATLLFWLDDRAEETAATWRFLDRRIADVMRIQKVRGRLSEHLPSLDRIVAALCRGLARRGVL